MKAPQSLWKQWSAQLRQFLPQIHGHRSKTLAFFVLGVILAGTTRVPRVAEALLAISPAKTPSIERRLARFLANETHNLLHCRRRGESHSLEPRPG